MTAIKKAFITFLFFLFSSFSFSQKLSISDLFKLNEMNLDDFDSFVLKKGYEFDNKDQQENYEEYHYSFDRNPLDNFSEFYISKGFFYFLKQKKISYQIIDKKEYLIIKEDLKKIGFKFIKTETTGFATFFDYLKNNVRVSLALIRGDNSKGRKINVYEISVVTKQ